MTRFGPLREAVAARYARAILEGLAYLHGHGIAHRDVKGANCLVDASGGVKLADFGASKRIEDVATLGEKRDREQGQGAGRARAPQPTPPPPLPPHTADLGFKSIKGTPYWMAPEVIKQTGAGRAADVWSAACTVLEMVTGKPPWSQCTSQVSALFHIAQCDGAPPLPDGLSTAARDFLGHAFRRDPGRRPSAAALLKHPWLNPTAAVVDVAAAAPLGAAAGALGGAQRPPSPVPEEEGGADDGPPSASSSCASERGSFTPTAPSTSPAPSSSGPPSTDDGSKRASPPPAAAAPSPTRVPPRPVSGGRRVAASMAPAARAAPPQPRGVAASAAPAPATDADDPEAALAALRAANAASGAAPTRRWAAAAAATAASGAFARAASREVGGGARHPRRRRRARRGRPCPPRGMMTTPTSTRWRSRRGRAGWRHRRRGPRRASERQGALSSSLPV